LITDLRAAFRTITTSSKFADEAAPGGRDAAATRAPFSGKDRTVAVPPGIAAVGVDRADCGAARGVIAIGRIRWTQASACAVVATGLATAAVQFGKGHAVGTPVAGFSCRFDEFSTAAWIDRAHHRTAAGVLTPRLPGARQARLETTS
jgi:hypothetical protein